MCTMRLSTILLLSTCVLGIYPATAFRTSSIRLQRSSHLQMNAEVTSLKSSPAAVRTTISALEVLRKEGSPVRSDTDRKEVNAIYGLTVNSEKENLSDIYTTRLLQRTDGPVPRSYLPTLLTIDQIDSSVAVDSTALFAVIEESLQWYFDTGGRASRVELSCPASLSNAIQSMGFIPSSVSLDNDVIQLRELDVQEGDNRVILSCDPLKFKTHCESRVTENNSNKYCLFDIIGRLAHDLGDPKVSIKSYTLALQANTKSAATFRNMGSAYHAIGDVQLAFASYQQAVQLDETDALVYLKLAFFYEDFATKDWIDAAEHSRRCYQYYLDKVDPSDTSILTRLGNLFVKEHDQESAVGVYKKVLELDESLDNVWFNMANAQIHIGDYTGAAISLQKTLDLDSTMSAARHMLRALSSEESSTATSIDQDYVTGLFNDHAPVYDSHMKKLMYSATRVIRQELATVYRAKFGIFDGRYGSDGSISGLDRSGSEGVGEGEGGVVGEMKEKAVIDLEFDDDLKAVDKVVENEVEVPVSGVVKVVSDKAYAAGRRIQKEMSDVSEFKEAQGPVGAGCSTYSSFMNKTLDILDIGCGTGGAGAWLKDYARNLVGVDLSENMVTLARKKMIYQELHVQPFSTYLQSSSKTFDLVVAADVLSYLGDLNKSFEEVSRVLRPGGHFVFTVEAIPEGIEITEKGYRLLKSGRFGYSKVYMDNIVKELKTPYTSLLAREFSPRLDVGVPVPGYLYIIRKEN